MKTTLLLFAMASSAFAAQPIVARITPEALAQLQQTDPMARLQKPGKDEAKVARPKDQSIIKQSTILNDGKNWTLIPNGAVVFLPEAMKSRVSEPPAGNLMTWPEFLASNISWITTTEVSFAQAAGKTPLPAEHTRFWTKQNKIVIAVHQRGPISVRITETAPELTKR